MHASEFIIENFPAWTLQRIDQEESSSVSVHGHHHSDIKSLKMSHFRT
jgi:hypothetical protein